MPANRNGVKILQEQLKAAMSSVEGGYSSYIWHEAAFDKDIEYISFSRALKEWNWKPIPWRMVNAVNLVRGHLGIREEGFLEDVGGPKPNPRPQDVHKPAPAGETEKKGWSNSGRLLLFYRFVRKAWHKIDESLEKVDILYDSLPGWVRNRERAKMPHQKIAALLRNWQIYKQFPPLS